MDTRWEICKNDLYLRDSTTGELDSTNVQKVDAVIDELKARGWKLSYPDDWPDLCSNCKSHIEEGTWHSVFNGNFWGSCEIHQGPPRGMIERKWADEDGTYPLEPYWGDPQGKNDE